MQPADSEDQLDVLDLIVRVPPSAKRKQPSASADAHDQHRHGMMKNGDVLLALEKQAQTAKRPRSSDRSFS